ncbi:unknown [Firmicutes bacterium CAG:449]|nr:unknown [Firmicutes bacterium CAG:449]
MFGPILLQKKNVDYFNFYQEELSSINKLLSLNLPNERKNELLTKKELIEKYGK